MDERHVRRPTRWRTAYSDSEAAQLQPAVTTLRRFEGAPLATAFAVQLVQRLRDQDPVGTPALRWLEERLAAQGTTADEIVRVEHQRQEAMNVTVRNVITSMRLMSAFDWAEFFESVSLVDAMLACRQRILLRWTLPHAIVTGTRSKNWLGAHSTRSSKSPDGSVLQTQRCPGRSAGSQRSPRRPAGGSGLLPHLERTCGLRAGTRLSRSPQRWLRRAYADRRRRRGYLGTIAACRADSSSLCSSSMPSAAAVGCSGPVPPWALCCSCRPWTWQSPW